MNRAHAGRRASATAKPANLTEAIGYCRVSTDQQASEGVSLAAQQQKIRDYCALNGLRLLRVEVDDGFSAKTLERPALARALASLEAGEAGALVVYKLDRLSRSLRDLLTLVEERFSEGKCGLHAVVERIDTVSPHGRAILSILGALAQLERENTAERVRMGLQFLRSIGVPLGALPYGQARGPRGPDDRRAPIVPSKIELEAIAEACALRSEGQSLRKIAAALSSGKRAPRRGRAWHPSTVASLLKAARKSTPVERVPWSAIGAEISLEIPLVAHAESKNSETKRATTISKKMSAKNAVAGALLALRRAPPELPVRVEITAVQGPRGKRWDVDNATARVAGARDEIAKWLDVDDREGLGVDEWIVRVDRAKKPAIRVRILPSEGEAK